jgi:hypothetical protein
MKAGASSQTIGTSPALTNGARPICGILKDFQWTLSTIVRHKQL